MIVKIRDGTHVDILSMKIGDWYRALMDDHMTTVDENDSSKRIFAPCRPELASPTTDWENVWRLSRMSGLPSDLMSFAFKLIHGLMVTRKRWSQMRKTNDSGCTLCHENVEDNVEHSTISCSFNNGVGASALEIIREQIPGISAAELLRFEIVDVPEDLERAIVYFSAAIFQTIWEKRMSTIRPSLSETRCMLESRCQILRETRFVNSATLLSDLVSKL